MKRNEHILDELKTIAPRLHAKKAAMPYAAPPEDYFSSFALRMLRHIQLQEADNTQPHVFGADVPQDYFENFAENMLAKVRNLDSVNELAGFAPILASIPRKMPYHLPEKYFATFSLSHTYRTTLTGPLRIFQRTQRWVAAAVVMGMLAIAWWLVKPALSGHAPGLSANIESQLKDVDDSAIEDFLEMEGGTAAFARFLLAPHDDWDSHLQMVSTESLSQYLEYHPLLENGEKKKL